MTSYTESTKYAMKYSDFVRSIHDELKLENFVARTSAIVTSNYGTNVSSLNLP